MKLTDEFQRELNHILTYWRTHVPDKKYGGFLGKVDNDNHADEHAPKGAVLNARILWTFSAAYNHEARPEYLAQARVAFEYLTRHFIDPNYGGVFWSVDYQGQPLDTKKQIYALAFAIYGLAEFYRATGEESALTTAQALFRAIEAHSFDATHGGYLEALAQDWTPLADLRLSAKDANEKKTMNTHLHILEAYANLYRVWPDASLKKQLQGLLTVFADHIIDPQTQHLILFFDENWTAKSTDISFGHDIEAAWLLLEAAEVLSDEHLIAQFRARAVQMAQAAAEGLDDAGGLNYEYEPARNHWNRERHWWVQAEAMVGFLNAFEISGEQFFYDAFLSVWEFTQRHIIDHKRGEWYWGVQADNAQLMAGEDKAGFWKCPYHNGRACLEVMRRLSATLSHPSC
ncbi:AGE family epimerase/isomerase [uncultured Hymenobacter sp.]|uniref:AGE family epimerase/isomerase n=1 Tax=uncultured Hymenobacter sp. TaxID=170016 RepID=UPI0035CC8E0C